MSFMIRNFAALVLSFQLIQTANAGFVDFENFSDFDSLTTEIPGLIFNDATVLTAGISLNEFDFPPHSGNNVIASFSGVLTINFDTPINLVGGFVSYADAAGVNLSLYDINNILLADAFFASPVGPLNIVSNQFISLGVSNISSMVVSLNSPIPDNPFTIDDLTYVPEPATVLLISLGMIGVHFSNIKSRKTRGV